MMRKLDELTKWGLKVNLNKTPYLCIGEQYSNIDLANEILKCCN